MCERTRNPNRLAGVPGFVVPCRSALARGVRPPPRGPEDFEPGAQRSGWQHEASFRLEQDFRVTPHFPLLSDSELAFMRSQRGPGVGVALHTTPCNMQTRIEPQLFRVLLTSPPSSSLARFSAQLPVWPSTRRPWHHRAACSRAGIFGRRGFAFESAAARVCREAGARVTTNVFVHDLDMGVPNALDGRRLEVVADGKPLLGGSQLAIDTTVVSKLHADGTPHRLAATPDGAVLRRCPATRGADLDPVHQRQAIKRVETQPKTTLTSCSGAPVS